MKRIDFIGIPGSGKTSLYRGMLDSRKEIKWLTPEEEKLNIARDMIQKSKYSNFKNHVKDKLSRLPGFKWSGKLLTDSIMSLVEDEALWQQRNEWKKLADACLSENRSSDTHPVRSFQEMFYLIQKIKEVATLVYLGSQETVIFEDSLSSRSGMVLLSSDNNGIDLFSFDVLRPAGIIYLKIDPTLVVSRIRSREKIILKHKGLSDDEIENQSRKEEAINDRILFSARNHGIPCLEIESNNELIKSVYLANQFISQI